MALSNTLVGVLNFKTLLLSILLITGYIWLAQYIPNDCDNYFGGPVFVLGFFVMLISLVGMIGSCCHIKCLLWIYLFLLFLLIIILCCSTALLFMSKEKFDYWLQKRVEMGIDACVGLPAWLESWVPASWTAGWSSSIASGVVVIIGWRIVAIFSIGLLIVLTLVCSIGCCALKNRNNMKRRREEIP